MFLLKKDVIKIIGHEDLIDFVEAINYFNNIRNHLVIFKHQEDLNSFEENNVIISKQEGKMIFENNVS